MRVGGDDEHDLGAASRRGSRRRRCPPCARAIASAIASPSPAPPPARATSARLKRSNACGRKSAGKPAPSSLTRSSISPSATAALEPDGPGAVTERVVDEVAERLLQPDAVAGEGPRRRRGDLQRAPRLARARVEAAGDRVEELARPSAARRAAAAGRRRRGRGRAGPPRAARAARRPRSQSAAPARAPRVRARPARGELQLGSEERERRPELVARVRDEPPLAREAGLEAVEHLVQRLAEAADLVARRRQRQPPVGALARDLGRAAAHRLDRPQRGACEEVAARRDVRSSASGPTTKSCARRPSSASSRSSSDAPDDEHRRSPSTARLTRRRAGSADVGSDRGSRK